MSGVEARQMTGLLNETLFKTTQLSILVFDDRFSRIV